MAINQIFSSKPSLDNINNVIKGIGLKTINDGRYFNLNFIEENIDNIIIILKTNLMEYYLPCKSKIYFNNIVAKKIITILRQCLKLYNYNINYKEQYIKERKKKIQVYKIVNNNTKVNKILTFN